MSTKSKTCYPKLSRLRKDLWAWHSDIESLMQGLDAPKKNALVKDENPEDKMNAKCFEMIHKLCRLSALSPDEIVELLKNADSPRPIKRFASSGQLSSGRLSQSPPKTSRRSRTRSVSPVSPVIVKPIPEKGGHRYRSPTRRQATENNPKASWSRSESPSPADECRKNLTFDADDEYSQKSGSKRQQKKSPISDKNSKKIIRDLEEQIIELEKENDELINNVEKLEKEVQWYKDNRDYWFQYCKDNDRNEKHIVKNGYGRGTEYDELRKQYDHLQGVYENICHVLNKGTPNGHLDLQRLQADAARYREERNNARLQVQEMNDKMNWYKSELKSVRADTGYSAKKSTRRYGKHMY